MGSLRCGGTSVRPEQAAISITAVRSAFSPMMPYAHGTFSPSGPSASTVRRRPPMP